MGMVSECNGREFVTLPYGWMESSLSLTWPYPKRQLTEGKGDEIIKC